MRPFQTIGFLVVVLVPVCALLWLGLRVADGEANLRRHQFDQLVQDRLADIRDRAKLAIEELEREVLVVLDVPVDSDAFRELGRTEPFVRQAFAVDGDGTLVYPMGGNVGSEGASGEEIAFIKRTAPIWDSQSLLHGEPGAETAESARTQDLVNQNVQQKDAAPTFSDSVEVTGYRPEGDSIIALAKAKRSGWITWHWQEGLHLLLWKRGQGGGVVGVEVERIALLSRIVAKLPTSDNRDNRIVLASSRGEPVHQWGLYQQTANEAPISSLVLSYPLDTWRLNYYAAEDQKRVFVSGGSRSVLLIGAIAIAVAFLTLAIFLFRDLRRRLREASERVSFVTRVSHELKTPLTNIRLYAELLDHEFTIDNNEGGGGSGEEEEEHADRQRTRQRTHQRIAVVVDESQRLTRLINNILTFSKHTRENLTISPAWVELDEVIGAIIEQFRPSLERLNLEPSLELTVDEPVWADADAVGQVIANLIANVIKYAAQGGKLWVESALETDAVVISVADNGSGISPRDSARIFKPFVRLSDSLSEGVSGTGIGLSIARELAILHGGGLTLAAPTRGARFELRIPRKRKDGA